MKKIKNQTDFQNSAEEYWRDRTKPYAFAIGRRFTDKDGDYIAVRWLTVNVTEKASGIMAAICNVLKIGTLVDDLPSVLVALEREEVDTLLSDYFHVFESGNHPNIEALKQIKEWPAEWQACIYVVKQKKLLETTPIENMYDAHFRLGLVSHRWCLPNELRIVVGEMMPKLKNLAWYAGGVMTVDEWNANPFRTETLLLEDKLPPYVWAMPLNEAVRILNPLVRFGAYLGDGTTVMPYGWINFNAGIKKGMVEGRIPGGVLVGEGTDLGAGSGILGTMSGGNKTVVSIGDNCLIEANAEVGISLGNNCRVCMNTCFHGNTPVIELFEDGSTGRRVKAAEFSGVDNITIWTNSLTGGIEVLHKPNKVGLNEALHQNIKAST